MSTTQNRSPCPALLDDPEWLCHQYEDLRLGTYEIGRLVGRAPSTVLHRLREHGIAVRPQRVSRSAECDGPWLASHYFDRDEYVAWCHAHGEKPDDDGGHGLSASACAKVAEVSRETIRRWLVQHDIERRGADDLSSKRKRRQHKFSLGPDARAALRRFEAADVVVGVEVRSDEIHVEYVTGRERWGLSSESANRLHFPADGPWWTRPLRQEGLLVGLLGEDGNPKPDDNSDLSYSCRYLRTLGFLEQRLLVAELVRDLTTEGWKRPEFTPEELDEDLRAVLADGTIHAVTPGYVRGQPGRPASGVPAGTRLALDLVDWGPLTRPGGLSLQEAWRDPRHVYWAIESLIRRGEDISREGIVHRMCVGRAEGVPRRAGGLWRPPAYWVALVREVLGQDDGVIVVDPEPGCGSKAVAVAAMGGIYAHPADVAVSPDSPLWEAHAGSPSQAEIVEDDDICAHVALVACAGFDDFEEAVAEYGYRCEQVVSRLPWRARERVLALPGARVVRLRSRPYGRDEVVAIWSQGSGPATPLATC